MGYGKTQHVYSRYKNNNMKTVKTTPRKRRKIKVGNDGYGNKNTTITKYKYGVEIEISNPHDWGRTTGIILSYEVIDALTKFIAE